MNVNTVVEVLINYLESHDWRSSLQRAVPLRKVRSKENTQKAFDYRNIRTEEALLGLPVFKLTKFEFRNALERYCIKEQKKLTFETEERNLKKMAENGTLSEDVSRFTMRAYIDGELMGEGNGSSMRIASSYAAWRALERCGVFRQSETSSEGESVCE